MAAYIIKDVHLFDGFEAHQRPKSVLVAGGEIRQIADFISDVAGDAVVIDGKGYTLLPGLIDAHTHVFRGVEEARGALAAGVTTLFDMHNVPANAMYMKKLGETTSDVPQIFSALYAATIDGGWPRAIVRHVNTDPVVLASLDEYPKLTTPEEAASYVKQNKEAGADFIKLMQESGECLTLSPLPAPTGELQAAVIKSAHEHGLLTFAHATNLRETLLVLEAGVDGMAHQFFDQAHTEDLVAAYKATNALLIPTLTAISSMMGLTIAHEWTKNEHADQVLNATSRQSMCDCMKISRPGCSIEFAYTCIKALKAEGIDIVCGTDSGPSIHGTGLGAAMHLEMSLYVDKCGFSPVEALRSATGVSAKRLNLPDRGQVAVGRRADLILVRGDPTQDINETTNIEKVWKKGVLCDIPRNG